MWALIWTIVNSKNCLWNSVIFCCAEAKVIMDFSGGQHNQFPFAMTETFIYCTQQLGRTQNAFCWEVWSFAVFVCLALRRQFGGRGWWRAEEVRGDEAKFFHLRSLNFWDAGYILVWRVLFASSSHLSSTPQTRQKHERPSVTPLMLAFKTSWNKLHRKA